MGVEFRPAEAADAVVLAPSLRAADRAEVRASDGLDAQAALTRALALSSEAYAGFVDGELVALFGVRRLSLAGRGGSPWLLTGEALSAHPRTLVQASRGVLHTWRQDYAWLGNWVDARNLKARRWLSWLGFTLHPAQPYGVRRLPFHPFEMEGYHD